MSSRGKLGCIYTSDGLCEFARFRLTTLILVDHVLETSRIELVKGQIVSDPFRLSHFNERCKYHSLKGGITLGCIYFSRLT